MDRKQTRRVLDRYRITSGKGFRLRDHDPGNTGGSAIQEEDGEELLRQGVARLSELQELLFANQSWSLLCVLQAMDAAGKDGTIKHVMSGINPQGVTVAPFRAPGPEDLAHDFLWRINRHLPADGQIGIFNRSHYEEVLVTRVHPEILAHERIPPALVGKHFWRHRLDDIAAWERYLHRQGTVVVKFFLNVSKAEQKRRFIDRLDHPAKNWKFSAGDIAERGHWNEYQQAYEAAISATATKDAPWYVVPADHKWFTRFVVVAAIVEALEALDLKPVKLSDEELGKLAAARRQLETEG